MRMKCAENVASMGKMGSTCRCSVVKVQGNRSLGSRWHRRDSIIKMYLKGVEWEGVD
jgi:hypothetical protein